MELLLGLIACIVVIVGFVVQRAREKAEGFAIQGGLDGDPYSLQEWAAATASVLEQSDADVSGTVARVDGRHRGCHVTAFTYPDLDMTYGGRTVRFKLEAPRGVKFETLEADWRGVDGPAEQGGLRVVADRLLSRLFNDLGCRQVSADFGALLIDLRLDPAIRNPTLLVETAVALAEVLEREAGFLISPKVVIEIPGTSGVKKPLVVSVLSEAPGACPYCRGDVKPSEELVRCRSCQTIHHDECWKTFGKCTLVGCGERKTTAVSVAKTPISSRIKITLRDPDEEEGEQESEAEAPPDVDVRSYLGSLGDGWAGAVDLSPWRTEVDDILLGVLGRLQPGVRTLCLRDCDLVTDAGLARLASLTELQSLDLSWCSRITRVGCAQLKAIPSLRVLDLSWVDQFSDACLESVRLLPNLNDLELSGCWHLTDRGVMVLCQGKPPLARLHLSNCQQLTDEALEHLAQLERLVHLDLSSCYRVTPAAIETLRAALPDCRVVVLEP